MTVMLFGQLATVVAFPATAHAAGEIEITTWEELANMSEDLNADYILMNDLGPLDAGYDTYASSTANGALGWLPIGGVETQFTGTFDGGGHTISGITIRDTNQGYLGLFGMTYNASITNINLNDVDIQVSGSTSYVGALVGYATDTAITQVSTHGTIDGDINYVGGIVGNIVHDAENPAGISESSSSVDIETTGAYVGGIAGYARGITNRIQDVMSSGDIAGGNYTGGLIGRMEDGRVLNARSDSTVISQSTYVGGLIGYITRTGVFSSFATGDVTGHSDVGGFIGRSWYGVVSHSFAYGAATTTTIEFGTDIGGFIGETDGSAPYVISSSAWNSDVNEVGIADGNAGYGVMGLSAEEMTDQSFFEDLGWDFDWTWNMGGQFPIHDGGIQYFEGSGTEEDPYLVESCAQLASMTFFPEEDFKLTTDLDCADTSDWNDGKGFLGIAYPFENFKFIGTFDGNEHTISNIYMNGEYAEYTGLFRYLGVDSSVFDLTIEDADIVGENFVGVLAGGLEGTATNIRVTGIVHGNNNVGGLVGVHANEYGLSNSSPLVYSWDGDSYEYVADVGEMIARGTDGEDYTVIDADKIAPKDDVYSMHIAQEYNEIVYYDQLALMLLEHEPGYTVVEPLMRDAGRDSLTTVSDTPTHQLIACTDMYGNDCLNQLKEYDNQWSYKDESEVNEWILDFGDLSQADRIQLVLRAARDYEATPAYPHRTVSVMGPDGEWVQIYGRRELGSDGTPRLRTIDLTGKFLTNDYRVKFGFDRLRVNYVAIDTSPEQPFTVTELQPTKADLAFRGYTAIDKTYFNDHDFDTVSAMPPEVFANQVGNFTKYGDVLPLLQDAEDQFVIMRHGDSMDIEFPATYTVTPGKELSYILFSDVVYKHANEETGTTVDPLPYSTMTEYPAYGYPMTNENQTYLREWNTRVYRGSSVSGSTIIDSSADVDVIGSDSNIGGLVGYNEKFITGSYATGYVYGNSLYVGGLVGQNQSSGEIVESYAANEFANEEGDIVYGEAPVEGGCYVGGFVGYTASGATVTDAYALHDAYASSCHVGGFAGAVIASEVTNAYAVGQAKGGTNEGAAGGFVGTISAGTLANVFWNSDVNPELETCGYEEEYDCDSEGSGSAKTSAELQNIITYTDTLGENTWDFDEIWGINASEHDGYPFLRWEDFTHLLDTPEEESAPVVPRKSRSGSRRGSSSKTHSTTNANTSGIAEVIKNLTTQSSDTSSSSSATETTTTGAPSTLSLPVRNLQFGMTGDDVKALQTILIGLQYQIPAGPTGYFGGQTRSALSTYQAASGITPAVGFFGPLTRAQMKSAGVRGLWW